ncbi:MAG: helix-turn-helix domain-containing protein [Lachnospiraceae bacterium]|nr:helix-turn-helix domain-containing protein [Lachnospiraceae bacterium]
MSVLNNLRKVRAEKSIRREELALAVNCSSRTIDRIETGDCYPNLELALRLAHYLEISTDELFQLDLKSLPEKGGPNEYEHLSDHSR